MDSAGAFGKGKRTVQAVRSRKGERERQEEKEGEERQGRQCETKSSQGRQTVRDDTDPSQGAERRYCLEPVYVYINICMYHIYIHVPLENKCTCKRMYTLCSALPCSTQLYSSLLSTLCSISCYAMLCDMLSSLV